MTWIPPLEMETWLVNVFAGTQNIFIITCFIVIAGMAAYFRMTTMLTAMMFVLFAVLMSGYLTGIYLIVVLLVGLGATYTISRLFQK